MDIYVQKDGQQLGPFTETKIRQGIDAGEIVPADLAWTTGKASWQPLSALINLDVNQLPPLTDGQTPSDAVNTPAASSDVNEGQVAPPTSLKSPSVGSVDKEAILYEDANNTALRVFVSSGRLKVGDDSYSLEGVTNVTVNEQAKHWRSVPRLWRRVGGVLAIIATLAAPWIGGGWWFLLIGCIGILVFVEDQRDQRCFDDLDNRYHDAEVVLMQHGKQVKLHIGRFRTCSPIAGGSHPMTPDQVEFRRNIQRMQNIAEAVGKAIAHKH